MGSVGTRLGHRRSPLIINQHQKEPRGCIGAAIGKGGRWRGILTGQDGNNGSRQKGTLQIYGKVNARKGRTATNTSSDTCRRRAPRKTQRLTRCACCRCGGETPSVGRLGVASNRNRITSIMETSSLRAIDDSCHILSRLGRSCRRSRRCGGFKGIP
jgi:hypothetical protein